MLIFTQYKFEFRLSWISKSGGTSSRIVDKLEKQKKMRISLNSTFTTTLKIYAYTLDVLIHHLAPMEFSNGAL